MAREEAVAEEWRSVLGFEVRYEVSSEGRVRSVRGGGRWLTGAVLRALPNKNRYLCVCLSTGTRDACGRSVIRRMLIHRLVAAAFMGQCPDGLVVNHIDGDRANNRVTNLEYVTRAQNSQHAVHVLGSMRGEAMGSSKLTEDQAREAHRLATIMPAAEIARRFGVSTPTICDLIRGDTWAHLGDLQGAPFRRRRLTAEQIPEIRALLARLPIREVARRFGVSGGCISGIAEGRSWRNVT